MTDPVASEALPVELVVSWANDLFGVHSPFEVREQMHNKLVAWIRERAPAAPAVGDIILDPETDAFLDEIILGFGAEIAATERAQNGQNLRVVLALARNKLNESAQKIAKLEAELARVEPAQVVVDGRNISWPLQHHVKRSAYDAMVAERDAARAELSLLRQAGQVKDDETDYEWEWQCAQRALDELGAIRQKHPDGPEFSLTGRIHALAGTHPSTDAIKAITSKSQARRVMAGGEDEVERVAEALARYEHIAHGEDEGPDWTWESAHDQSRTEYLGMAQAAISAMRGEKGAT